VGKSSLGYQILHFEGGGRAREDDKFINSLYSKRDIFGPSVHFSYSAPLLLIYKENPPKTPSLGKNLRKLCSFSQTNNATAGGTVKSK
jgi:hypothetical protein